MKKRARFVKKSLSVVAAATLLLAGCSQGSGGASTEPLTVWGMGDEVKELVNVAAEFTAETGIEVKVQAIPWSSARDKLLTAVASKNGPDVIQMGTSWMPEFQEAGALANIGEYASTYANLKPENFVEGALETTYFDNNYYGVPWTTEARVLYYRTDILASVGYNEAPKTWEELEDAARKLSERGENMYGLDIDAKEQTLGFMFARQNGSELFDATGKPLFNQPEFVGAVEYLNNMVQKGYAPKQDLMMDVSQKFSGDAMVPMFISGPWMITAINDTIPEIEGKWTTAVLPKGTASNESSLGGSNLTIFEHSKNKDTAAQFLDYMSKKETQINWLNATNSLPTVRSAWDEAVIDENPHYAAFKEQINAARPMPLIPQFEEIAQNYLKHYERIILGGADVKQEMDLFNAETISLLEKAA